MIRMKGVTILLIYLFAHVTRTEAYPSRAGHCGAGDLTGRHHGDVGRGDLVGQGGFTISIGGNTPISGVENAMELNINQEYTVRIERPNLSFRGLLFRLPVQNAFSFPTDSIYTDLFQLHPFCASDVSAVTHRSRDDKSVVEFTLKHTEVGTESLEITSVIVSQNNWYYSIYYLNFIDSGIVPALNRPVPTVAINPAPTLVPTPVHTHSHKDRL